MKQEYLSTFRELLNEMTFDKLGMLLNVHSLFISTYKDELYDDAHCSTTSFNHNDTSWSDWVYYRIENFTKDEDYPLVLRIILMILDDCSFRRILSILPAELVIKYLAIN